MMISEYNVIYEYEFGCNANANAAASWLRYAKGTSEINKSWSVGVQISIQTTDSDHYLLHYYSMVRSLTTHRSLWQVAVAKWLACPPAKQ